MEQQKPRRDWWRWSQITPEEYRANLNGMNTFFGAVLGFVIADIATEDMAAFGMSLIFTAALVISILYVSASSQRWLYAAMTLFLIWQLPKALPDDVGDPRRLQVVLAAWTFMVVILEALWDWQQRREAKRTHTPP